MADADGNWVATDGTSNASPKVRLILEGAKTWSWFVETSSDGTWTDWSVDVTLPDDTSAVWKAFITIDQAVKKEFHIKDWGMTLNPSESPTTSPSLSPTKGPSTTPTKSPTLVVSLLLFVL